MAEQYTILGGKVHVYQTSEQQSVAVLHLSSPARIAAAATKEDSLSKAKEDCRGLVSPAARQTPLRRNQNRENLPRSLRAISPRIRHHHPRPAQQDYVRGQHSRSTVHLVPFFGHLGLSEITSGKVQEYRIHRHEESVAKHGKPPAYNTMHQEIVTLRQTLKTAIRQGWLDRLPDLSEPYRSSPKISHRAWFSPEEYKQLYEATRKRAHEPKQARFKWECEQLHDYVLFSANTGLRPDEARRLQFRDVTIVEDEAASKRSLRSRYGASEAWATARACMAPCVRSSG